MQQEKLFLNTSNTATTIGTTIYGFMPIDDSNYENLPISYLILDLNNNPINIVYNIFDAQYTIDNNNVYHYDQTKRFLTGKTITQKYDIQLSASQKQSAISSFKKMIASSSANTSTIQINYNTNTGNTFSILQQPSSSFTYVKFEESIIDDYYTNISLERTIDNLNTLSVHNTVINNTITKSSPTGVLFGKITALQKIKDEFGNNINLPLANTTIGIFNTSNKFPAISSVDSNGNRIPLNLQENCNSNLYFNAESYSADTQYLLNDYSDSSIPEQYRYTTITNENGEFILYDLPIGQQTLMFEIDLLKQGLTKDEVALNFFPYPTDDSPNISTVPHYYFRQISVNIAPSWGTFQTGYTQINISVPLDLRKWTTYILPPVSVFGQLLEQSVSNDVSNSLKIDIRDMTVDFTINQDLKPVRVAQIPDDLDRDNTQQYFWNNEIVSNKTTIEFKKFGCAVFKLPANMYDPNGYKTDKNGVPTLNKGVWLSAYQFKEYVNDSWATRKTGTINSWDSTIGNYTRSHFDLNNGILNPSQIIGTSKNPYPSIGLFPYEKPWSINYPTKYSIPNKPVVSRFTDGNVIVDGRVLSNGNGGSDTSYVSNNIIYGYSYVDINNNINKTFSISVYNNLVNIGNNQLQDIYGNIYEINNFTPLYSQVFTYPNFQASSNVSSNVKVLSSYNYYNPTNKTTTNYTISQYNSIYATLSKTKNKSGTIGKGRNARYYDLYYFTPVYTTKTVTNTVNNPINYWIDDPAWADGDLVGRPIYGLLESGFGSQYFQDVYFGNRISQVATSDFMYKYEGGVAWNEQYANGHQPILPTGSNKNKPFLGQSRVLNAEQYQRLECGYGYFLKPQAWPRVVSQSWGDTYFQTDVTLNEGLQSSPGITSPSPSVSYQGLQHGFYSDNSEYFVQSTQSFAHPNDVYNLNNLNLSLCLDDNVSIQNGTLDIYRIVNSGNDVLPKSQNFILPSSIILHCNGSTERCFSWSIVNNGSISITTVSSLSSNANGYVYYGNGDPSKDSQVNQGESFTLEVGQVIYGYGSNNAHAFEWSSQNLPANCGYDNVNHCYNKANYILNVYYNTADGGNVVKTSPYPGEVNAISGIRGINQRLVGAVDQGNGSWLSSWQIFADNITTLSPIDFYMATWIQNNGNAQTEGLNSNGSDSTKQIHALVVHN